MKIRPQQSRPFPQATLSRMTGYSQQRFSETIRDLGQVDYTSFQGQTRISGDNAYVLAASATLVYESPADQAAFLSRPGVKSFRFLDSADNQAMGLQAPDTGTQVGLIETDDALIVSARGTVFATEGPGFFDREWQDVCNNLNSLPVSNYNGSALVHAGFKNAADGIWEQLEPHLRQAGAQGKALHFTGHSLGAAIATHLADRTMQALKARAQSLVTFGGPATGWGDQKQHLEESGLAEVSLRFADSGDPTVWAVPAGRHGGQEAYIDSQGKLAPGDGWNVADRAFTAYEDVRQLRHPISHHHPFNYCQQVDNNRAVLDQWP